MSIFSKVHAGASSCKNCTSLIRIMVSLSLTVSTPVGNSNSFEIKTAFPLSTQGLKTPTLTIVTTSKSFRFHDWHTSLGTKCKTSPPPESTNEENRLALTRNNDLCWWQIHILSEEEAGTDVLLWRIFWMATWNVWPRRPKQKHTTFLCGRYQRANNGFSGEIIQIHLSQLRRSRGYFYGLSGSLLQKVLLWLTC